MILWRIAAETRHYRVDDMTGGGAARNPGRWNELGQPVIYAAPTIAMAVLETSAHMRDPGLPLNRYLVRIEVPESVWNASGELDPIALPASWDAIPAGATSAAEGSAWIRSLSTAVLLVPSVIVPEERVALINPTHSDAGKLRCTVVRRFDYNRVFRSAAA